ncbi:MAG: nucleotidyltransferase [Bacillota bacterium]
MKVLGIITEYNPFHNGHKYHIEKSIKKTNADYVICIMSGHFLQRGIPAILNKWKRSKMAIENNIDLIIELPTIYSLSSAEYFAKGAIEIFNKMNIVDCISFGSENGDISNFLKVGRVYSEEPDKYVKTLKDELKKGVSFPKAREKSLKEFFKKENINILSKPNNILGIEYSKAIFNTKSNIKLETIKRIKNDYNQTNLTGNISSATSIRNQLKKGNLNLIKKSVPKNCFKIIKENKNNLVFRNDFEKLIFYKLRTIKKNKLKNISDVVEGLENRIIEKALNNNSLEKLILDIKTKRYTYTKIQRIIFKTLLDIDKSFENISPKYIRILGFNKKGQFLLKKLKDKSSLPLITNLKNYTPQDKVAKKMIQIDINSTNIYNMFTNNKKFNLEYKNRPIIKNKDI